MYITIHSLKYTNFLLYFQTEKLDNDFKERVSKVNENNEINIKAINCNVKASIKQLNVKTLEVRRKLSYICAASGKFYFEIIFIYNFVTNLSFQI